MEERKSAFFCGSEEAHGGSIRACSRFDAEMSTWMFLALVCGGLNPTEEEEGSER